MLAKWALIEARGPQKTKGTVRKTNFRTQLLLSWFLFFERLKGLSGYVKSQ